MYQPFLNLNQNQNPSQNPSQSHCRCRFQAQSRHRLPSRRQTTARNKKKGQESGGVFGGAVVAFKVLGRTYEVVQDGAPLTDVRYLGGRRRNGESSKLLLQTLHENNVACRWVTHGVWNGDGGKNWGEMKKKRQKEFVVAQKRSLFLKGLAAIFHSRRRSIHQYGDSVHDEDLLFPAPEVADRIKGISFRYLALSASRSRTLSRTNVLPHPCPLQSPRLQLLYPAKSYRGKTGG